MARSRQYIEWVKAAHVFPCAGPPCFLDDELFRFNDLDDDPRTSSRTRRCSSPSSRAAGIDNAHLLVPGSVVEIEGGDCRVRRRPPTTTRADPFARQGRATSTSTEPTGPAGSRPSTTSWTTRAADLVADLGDVVRAADGAGADHVGGHRRQRRARRWVRTDAGLPRLRRTVGAGVGGRAVRLQDHGRPPARSTTLVDEHVEDWVNSLFLSCRFARVAAGAVQRVRDDVLQGARSRTDRLRRAQLPPGAAAPTSSSSATAGGSSGGARTARPISPASARSPTACSRARSTTGSSSSRPGAASRATTVTSAASVWRRPTDAARREAAARGTGSRSTTSGSASPISNGRSASTSSCSTSPSTARSNPTDEPVGAADGARPRRSG